jgi:hypothetical protein
VCLGGFLDARQVGKEQRIERAVVATHLVGDSTADVASTDDDQA